MTKELAQASSQRQSRAAFGSLIRRNIEEIIDMTNDERANLLVELGMPASYQTEISKEVAVWKYDNSFF